MFFRFFFLILLSSRYLFGLQNSKDNLISKCYIISLHIKYKKRVGWTNSFKWNECERFQKHFPPTREHLFQRRRKIRWLWWYLTDPPWIFFSTYFHQAHDTKFFPYKKWNIHFIEFKKNCFDFFINDIFNWKHWLAYVIILQTGDISELNRRHYVQISYSVTLF